MRLKLSIAAMSAALVMGLAPSAFAAPPGTAQSPTGTAPVAVTLNAGIGTRVVSDAGSTLTMTQLAGATTTSANYSIKVVETSVSGANPFTVTGQLFDTQATPVANQVAQTATPANTIPGSAFGVSNVLPTALTTAPAGVTPAAAASGNLSAALSLYSVTESTSAVYTNTWTGTGTITLTPPNGTKTGAYSGTLVETLFY
jgi:hypothetical protein